MSEKRDRTDRTDTRDQREDAGREQESRRTGDTRSETTAGERLLGWFTETLLRVALAVIGLVLLLVALGQMVGVDTIGLLSDALASEVVQWALVAVFALLLIVAATKRWGLTDEMGSRR